MAQRAGTAHDMIPLAHWLVEKSHEDQVTILAPPSLEPEAVEPATEDEVRKAQAVTSLQEAQLQVQAKALREAEEQVANMAQEHARKERELTDRLGAALSLRLAEEVEMAFQSLAQHVEDAVAEALMPFLETAVRDRAITSLVDLIRREVRNPDLAVLEIRAPASLHAPLAEALGQTGVAVTISDAAVVDIVCKGERLRFQDLASAWCAAITKDET
jgi:hypothetical protein